MTPDSLRKSRRYVIVLAFVIGAILTPPDVFSQTLLAVPMILLFEIGLFLTKYFVPRERESASASASETADAPTPASSYGPETEPESERDMDAEFLRAQEDEQRLNRGDDKPGS